MTMIQRPPHTSSHPLDVIPLFRRWPCSPWRDVLYTGIWNSLIAIFLTAANMLFSGEGRGFLDFFGPTLVISNVVGYLIHAVLSGADWLLRGWPSRLVGLPRVLYFLSTVGLCVVAGIVIGTGLLKGVNPVHYLTGGADLAPLLPFALFTALIMVIVLVSGERRVATETLAARQGEQIASAAQLLAEARLRALQAQIEPHFLYNTLANVVGLIDTSPAQARHMLERFIDYLRASLAASRAEEATLGAELDLVAAYLDVLAVRMGTRLSYRIEADGCREIGMAPMLLQPIVENAVAHGLEPKVEGGDIVIRASCRDGQLCIEVSDTGAGLGNAPPKPGGGVGLSNLRARLRSIYGPGAQVQLLENEPCGITVRLLLPLKDTPSSTIHAPC
ncbi:sensor histidine kinase [Massilia pseudoviolaceinigra]|uniref:sensor histidine kinase n=1 Tax=Massilia pseudoviolaceinigra TaxID=3057165 RepID=UPI002796AF87|nr:histidine kinase [Massilia sp. CCM 9206]MDQ1920288.1 histidine kinase [Massilia sp. CCM 9206]